ESLQDISGAARREDGGGDVKYEYMIYDCFIPNEPELLYADRKKILDDIFSAHTFTYSKLVETFDVYSYEEIHALYESFLTEGYEGAMIRTDDKYHYSYN